MCQSEDILRLNAPGELTALKFNIPDYQRGYRWSRQQVTDLLDDLREFIDNGNAGIYCLQPLVVISHDDEENEGPKAQWDVIDGQQRLTTIHILLSYLGARVYKIKYTTRAGSEAFLEKLAKAPDLDDEAFSNSDFYHMHQARKTIGDWFNRIADDAKRDSLKQAFREILSERVKFIWYEAVGQDPIEVFTRLNIGKIPLTDSELIKALLLNRSNFLIGAGDGALSDAVNESIRLQQLEIASEWDMIEYTLQNDEFWLFINNLGYNKPTRIDFILNIIRRSDLWHLQEVLKDDYEEKIGNDEHQTFRYFYEYFKHCKAQKKIDADWLRHLWLDIKRYFRIFEEWYNSLTLYHYVGYLVNHSSDVEKKLIDLVARYERKDDTVPTGKKQFIEQVKEDIRNSLKIILPFDEPYGEVGQKKGACRPLLLLHNIQTVINQNHKLKEDEKYGLATFYKFPFHLFKKEGRKKNGKGWEVEHIASNSGDDFESEENRCMWLESVKYAMTDSDLKQRIDSYLQLPAADDAAFATLHRSIIESEPDQLTETEKQWVWNFALLDSATNEEYQNSPFPIKRVCVLAKEKGQKKKARYENNRFDFVTTDAIAFVPPCTKNVFVKAYCDTPHSLGAWTREDALAYLDDIYATLSEFLPEAVRESYERLHPASSTSTSTTN